MPSKLFEIVEPFQAAVAPPAPQPVPFTYNSPNDPPPPEAVALIAEHRGRLARSPDREAASLRSPAPPGDLWPTLGLQRWGRASRHALWPAPNGFRSDPPD